jgi:two-component system, LytTR family, sensor kinase
VERIPHESAPRTYLTLREIKWRAVLGLFVILTTCLFFYRQLDYVANAEYRPPLLTLLEEAIGALAGILVFPLIYLTAIRFPLPSPRWRRNVFVHLLAVCSISLVHTTLIAGLRTVLFPVLGFENHYGYLSWRYPMEFAHLFIFYWLGIGLIYLFHEVRFAREHELRQARLETSLAEAQLQNLRLQLEPHFLFNALNAISAAIYENPRVADEMIGRLSELLRQLLKQDATQEVTLAREIELLKLYTRIMEARLESRLTFSVDIEEKAREVLVPQLILQPLVENAIRHGMNLVSMRFDISVEGRLEGNGLRLAVRDHGAGLPPPDRLTRGIGLRNTAERLERLYGARQSVRIENADGGGTIVELRVPVR